MTDSPRFDVDACRGAFPQLADGIAYFENAGGSYVPSPVPSAEPTGNTTMPAMSPKEE